MSQEKQYLRNKIPNNIHLKILKKYTVPAALLTTVIIFLIIFWCQLFFDVWQYSFEIVWLPNKSG